MIAFAGHIVLYLIIAMHDKSELVHRECCQPYHVILMAKFGCGAACVVSTYEVGSSVCM